MMYPTPSLSRLDDDIVHLILESDSYWWPCDFQRLALVSSVWLGPVRKRLYASITLRSFRPCRLLANTLSENSHLRKLVRDVDLRPSSELDGYGFAVKDLESLRFILGLGGFRKVALGGDLAVRSERFLHSLVNSSAITQLRIDGNQLCWAYGSLRNCRPASLLWDDSMAAMLPSLEVLRLSNLILEVTRPLSPSRIQLAELSLDRVDILSGYLHHMSGNWTTLRSLSVVATSSSDLDLHVRLLLDRCGPCLETLNYEVEDVRLDEAIFDDQFQPCPSLRELRLDGLDVKPDTLSSIGQRCENLQHLSVLGRVVRVTAQEWASFIASGALPCLRQITMPNGSLQPASARWPDAMWRPVLEACSARGIKLGNAFLRPLI